MGTVKRIALRCWSSNSDYNADFDYALVTVTPEFIALTEKRHKQFLSIDEPRASVSRIHYYDCTPEYFSESELDAWYDEHHEHEGQVEIDSLIDGGETEFLPEAFAPRKGDESGDFRSECDHMLITQDGVSFECVPKHSSITISTAYISWKDLTEMLYGEVTQGVSA